MGERITSRTRKAVETRKNVLEHGIRLIRTRGFEKVSVNDIAKSAGVSVGTFYYYYPSKEDLLKGMPWRIDTYFEKEVVGKLTSGDCAGNIKIFFSYYAKHTKKHGWSIIKNLFATDTAFVISDKRFLQIVLLDLIEKGQRGGDVTKNIPAKEIMRFMLIAAHGVALDWAMSKGKSDIFTDMEEITGRLFQTFLVTKKEK